MPFDEQPWRDEKPERPKRGAREHVWGEFDEAGMIRIKCLNCGLWDETNLAYPGTPCDSEAARRMNQQLLKDTGHLRFKRGI